MVQLDEYRRYQLGIDELSKRVQLRSEPRLTVLEAHRQASLGYRNIVGFGIGVKVVRGIPQASLAVCGFVVRKAPPEIIEPDSLIEDLVHTTWPLDSNVLTDVLEVGRPKTLGLEYKRRVPGGATVRRSNLKKSEHGTLGGWLTDDQGKIYLLSCWHCLDGTQQSPPPSLLAKHENQDLADLVASVNPEWDPKYTPPPTVDASIAELRKGTQVPQEGDFILKIGEISGTEKVGALTSLPLSVRMYGAGSGLRDGRIWHYGTSITLDMPKHVQVNAQPPSLVYDQQLLIFPDTGQFAQGGDSGALVLTENNKVVGMIVGGTDSSFPTGGTRPLGVATPIDAVLDGLTSQTKALKGLRFFKYP